MVDVGAKTATLREASAEAIVKLPPAVARELARTGHRTKKGPVFDTAIIAGVMAAKRTHEIIPFCHPLALERCTVDIADARRRPHPHRLQRRRASQDRRGDGSADRRQRRGAHDLRHVQGAVARHRDRTRAPAPQDRRQARLSTQPNRGKKDMNVAAPSLRPGARRRPQHAHAARQGRHRIRPGETQLDAAMKLLEGRVARAFVSVRADQRDDPARARYAQIVDRGDIEAPSPASAPRSPSIPDAAWLVLACDLPFLDARTLDTLIARARSELRRHRVPLAATTACPNRCAPSTSRARAPRSPRTSPPAATARANS